MTLSPLSSSDLHRINKLEQVHVMTRHGSRTHHDNLQKYFPAVKQYYQCNISSITSRVQYIDSQNEQYFVSMLRTYQNDDNWLQHSNCQRMQSYPNLIEQHQQNAHILINAYMQNDDSPSHLFNLNQNEQSMDQMKFYTSDRERCMMSTMVLVSTLLNISSSATSAISPTIETITNDRDTNPYSHNLICETNEQYKQWQNKYLDDIYTNFIEPKHNQIMHQDHDLFALYRNEGGLVGNSSVRNFEHPGYDSMFFYCNGFDIPLTNETFWALVDAHIRYSVAIHPNKESEDENERYYAEKKQCFAHFRGIPMYKRYFDDIMAMKQKKDGYKKFILHSAHDSSIDTFLNGLGMNDGITPYFAQMMTLEIYSENGEAGKYLFRFTNKGLFVPYEYCADEYDVNESELCDLDILLQYGFAAADVNVSNREWATDSCASVLDECRCGYCNGDGDETDKSNDAWQFEGVSFIFGILCGMMMLGILMIVMNYFRAPSARSLQKYQMTEDESSPEIEENLTSYLTK